MRGQQCLWLKKRVEQKGVHFKHIIIRHVEKCNSCPFDIEIYIIESLTPYLIDS